MDAHEFRRSSSSSAKGNGFKQPNKTHSHWHVDISYINVGGTFYYLISVLDGVSRYIVHFDFRKSMTEVDVEIVCQAAIEKHPGVKPRIVSDNGPQLISRTYPRRTSRKNCHVCDAETCPSDSQRPTSFMMVSPSVAADKNREIVNGRFCHSGDHLSTNSGSLPRQVVEGVIFSFHFQRKEARLIRAKPTRSPSITRHLGASA
ncbi:MAG: transposase family protein [Planctomycetaceae bacterium]|nr:transposase family protein [Planctomycetaceae bacterium]